VCVRCVQLVSTLTHEKIRCWRLIKPRWKCNVEVKIKCVMQNEQIDGLVTNHSHAPLPEQERTWSLDVEEMKSFSKINLRDVSWLMSIKDARKPKAPIIVKFSKERYISLALGGRQSCATRKYDWSKWGAPFNMKNIFLQIKNTKPRAQIQSLQSPIP
jgi:hypothetical protein